MQNSNNVNKVQSCLYASTLALIPDCGAQIMATLVYFGWRQEELLVIEKYCST